MNRLQGKTAVITGGNSGIGYATAELFASEGATVIITGRREQAIKDAVKALGPNVRGVVSDTGSMVDIRALPARIREMTDRVDILFTNAGVAFFAPFEQTTEEQVDQTLNINFKGLYFTVQGLLPLIPDGGSVILNATILVHSGLETASIYAASKGAVLSLNKTLAIEFASRNIRVNAVSPGPISTPIYSKMGMAENVVQDFAAGVQAKIPLKRFGEPKDVAQAALFLASSDSSFLTGSEISIDGGKSMAF